MAKEKQKHHILLVSKFNVKFADLILFNNTILHAAKGS